VPFKLKAIPGKGFGLVATRKLVPSRTPIISEKPLMAAFTKHHDSVQAAFEQLPDKLKEKALSLHDPNPDGPSNPLQKIVRIFFVNCIRPVRRKEIEDDGRSLMYETISRLNHSCAPNIVCSLEAGSATKMQAWVCRDVAKGKELVIDYKNNMFDTKEQRQKQLMPWWFVCACPVCSLTGDELAKNDAIRKRIQKAHADMEKQVAQGNKLAALDLAEHRLTLIDELSAVEMVEVRPLALLDCWRVGRMLNVADRQGRPPPLTYRKEAYEVAQYMGDFYTDYFDD